MTRLMVKVPRLQNQMLPVMVTSGRKCAQGMGVTAFVVDKDPDEAIELVRRDIIRCSDMRPTDIEIEIDSIQSISPIISAASQEYKIPSWLLFFLQWFKKKPVVPPTKPSLNPELYCIPQIGFDKAWRDGYLGTGVRVGVNDTGCGPNKYIGVIKNINTIGFERPIIESDNDNNGHGSFCSGQIKARHDCADGLFGGAPECELFIYKAGEHGFYTSDLIEAIDLAVADGVKILSNSWGGPFSNFMQQAITSALNQGMLIVKATGNETSQCPDPYKDCILVTAMDKNDKPSFYTNWVAKELIPNTLATYGDDIIGHAPHDKKTQMSGTSMATPLVAAAAALVTQKYPDYTAKQIMEHLLTKCITPLNNQFGVGKLNLMGDW